MAEPFEPFPRGALASSIGRVGVWSFALDACDAEEEADLAAELEELGFRALWVPEGFGGKEAFAHAGLLLSATEKLVVATGIASIWARDPMAMSSGARIIAGAFPGRFVLGMGVSHKVRAEGRGHAYRLPLETMRAYLDAMDEAPAPRLSAPPRVLAALGPRMLHLARERASGAHSYFVTVEHTARAREILGPDRLLAPEQLAVLEPDPAKARAVVREFIGHYLFLPNYRNNLVRLGFGDDDFAEPYSERLVDAVSAWGDAGAIKRRVEEHFAAGADHVALQVLGPDASAFPIEQLRELAPTLLS